MTTQSPGRPQRGPLSSLPFPTTGRRLAALGVTAILTVAACGSTTPTPTPAATTSVPASGSAAASASTPATAGSPAPALGGVTAQAPGPASDAGSRFGGGLIVADRANGRIIVLDAKSNILWRFPADASSIPAGQTFMADDAFLSPDGKSIVANEEDFHVIVRIDVATRKIVWEYGRFGHAGAGPGELNTPDDAYPLANGDVVVADIRNCRILEIAPDKHIVHQWGTTGVCRDNPPYSYNNPNGDTPMPDGGLLITEIGGSRVVRLDASGKVLFDIHVPVLYPSDAQLAPDGTIVVSDFSLPGQVVDVTQTGKLVWRYRPTSGEGMLNHPSLAVPLPDGTIVLNDDGRDRVIVVDPKTGQILWQYGHTDHHGTAAGYLRDPDGINVTPIGTVW